MKPIRLTVNKMIIVIIATALGIGAAELYAISSDIHDTPDDTYSGELVFSGKVLAPTCERSVKVDGKPIDGTIVSYADIPAPPSTSPGAAIPDTEREILLAYRCTDNTNQALTISMSGTTHTSLENTLTDSSSKTNIGVHLTLSDGTGIIGAGAVEVSPNNLEDNRIKIKSNLVATDRIVNAGEFRVVANYIIHYK